jgi:hypothetical protein
MVWLVYDFSLHYDRIAVTSYAAELEAFPAERIHCDIEIKSSLVNSVWRLDGLQLFADKINFAARQNNVSVVAVPSYRRKLESICAIRHRGDSQENDSR